MHRDGLVEGGLERLLGYRLARARVLPDRLFEHEVGRPLDLRPVEFCVLTLAHANPGISPGRLADQLAMSRPQATQALDRLESRGLVQRRRSAEDGRGSEVRATGAGARLARDAMARLEAAEQAALQMLTRAERALLLELLGKLGVPAGDER
jgi:DNA-binding MarR family transcriptional regulator